MLNVRSANPSEVPLIVDFQLRMAEESEGARLDRATLTRGVSAVLDGKAQASY